MNPWIPHLLRAGGGGGAVLPTVGLTMLAKLTSSLILDEGTGGPTWSRATKAWGFNELGYLEELASGCAFFGGARLVRNRVLTKSEDFSNAAWTKTAVTVSGTNVVVCTNATTAQRISQESGAPAAYVGQTTIFRARVEKIAGGAQFLQITASGSTYGSGQYCNFSLSDGTLSAVGCTASSVLVGTDTYDITIKVTATSVNNDFASIAFITSLADTRLPNFVGDGIKSFRLLRFDVVDVTGYDASYVPEYVSVGVVATPFFGAGIDGAKYFETDWQGAPIAAANLLRVRREAAAINNLLYSRDLRNDRWKSAQSAGSELVTNGTFPTDLSGWSSVHDAGGSASVVGEAAVLVGNAINVSARLRQTVTAVSGKTYTLTADITTTNVGAPPLTVWGSGYGSGTLAGGSIADGAQTLTFTATSNALYIQVQAYSTAGASQSTFDNISIKESAVQCTQATGLDGIANTATTLTATAADAIILQPIALASAARCASAYVKRRTGTGTISFTQDGGSTWTDITAQINSSTWSRVQITSTLANPSVGFKISTSGDAIDVDVVQNEAGAVATSPIVTTTAAITRNADSLAYQTAGNIDFAVGTIYCSVKTLGVITTAEVAVSSSASALFYRRQGGANTSFSCYDGTNLIDTTGLSNVSTGNRKRAMSYGPAGIRVSGDGLAPAAGLFVGNFGSAGSITIGGSTGGGNAINGYIGPVAIYNYQMTDAELQAITT